MRLPEKKSEFLDVWDVSDISGVFGRFWEISGVFGRFGTFLGFLWMSRGGPDVGVVIFTGGPFI